MTALTDMKIVPLLNLDKDQVQYYWQTLYMDGLLDDRLCDIKNPTWTDVREMIVRMGKNIFHVLNGQNEIEAEFTLENRTGNAWQIHFSCSPHTSAKRRIAIARDIGEELFTWEGLDSLYGLTPVTNKLACMFVLRSGFKKVGILHKGTYEKGELVDAMISTRVKK